MHTKCLLKKNNPKTFFKFPNVKKKNMQVCIQQALVRQNHIPFRIISTTYYCGLISMKIQRKHCHI